MLSLAAPLNPGCPSSSALNNTTGLGPSSLDVTELSTLAALDALLAIEVPWTQDDATTPEPAGLLDGCADDVYPLEGNISDVMNVETLLAGTVIEPCQPCAPALGLLPATPLDLPMPPVDQLAVPLDQDVVEQWVKYGQKRVADGNVPKAILKQSYKCCREGCCAVMVKEKNTVADGPHAPFRFCFYGTHSHPISALVQQQMQNATFCDYTYTGGRLKRRSRPY
jgi:hypothetical protein